MMQEPNCSKRNCKHYEGVKWLGKNESTEVNFCKAFPNGIPDQIAYGDDPHRTPVEGDQGIQYERSD